MFRRQMWRLYEEKYFGSLIKLYVEEIAIHMLILKMYCQTAIVTVGVGALVYHEFNGHLVVLTFVGK